MKQTTIATTITILSFTTTIMILSGCVIQMDDSPYMHLKHFEWNESQQYEIDVFDCSQMSAYIEADLEEAGYHAVICTSNTNNSDGHAWILAEFPDQYIAYETTSCIWVFPDIRTAMRYPQINIYIDNPESQGFSYYNPDQTYESVDDYKLIKDFETNFAREWSLC